MVKADDLGEYYRIPADNRDLNYDQYFTNGYTGVAEIEEYHSHNTKRLNVDETKALLMKLEMIRKDIC